MNNKVEKRLGEIVLRVKDLDKMQQFYETVIGLDLLIRFDDTMVYFKIAAGFEGHTQVIALFQESVPSNFDSHHYMEPHSEKSTLHHFTLSLSLPDFKRELHRLTDLGIELKWTEHAWVKWRSFYVQDPEGNVVEFVCFDESVE